MKVALRRVTETYLRNVTFKVSSSFGIITAVIFVLSTQLQSFLCWLVISHSSVTLIPTIIKLKQRPGFNAAIVCRKVVRDRLTHIVE